MKLNCHTPRGLVSSDHPCDAYRLTVNISASHCSIRAIFLKGRNSLGGDGGSLPEDRWRAGDTWLKRCGFYTREKVCFDSKMFMSILHPPLACQILQCPSFTSLDPLDFLAVYAK